MFRGRIYYQKGGYMDNAIRFLTDNGGDGGGVATTTYSFSMTQDERYEMARRITAALNLTRDMETEEIERKAGMTSDFGEAEINYGVKILHEDKNS
jgi:hypothetical protein